MALQSQLSLQVRLMTARHRVTLPARSGAGVFVKGGHGAGRGIVSAKVMTAAISPEQQLQFAICVCTGWQKDLKQKERAPCSRLSRLQNPNGFLGNQKQHETIELWSNSLKNDFQMVAGLTYFVKKYVRNERTTIQYYTVPHPDIIMILII